MPQTARISWPDILTEAAAIVSSYDSGVTLRQLFYRLVSRQLLPNTEGAYKGLSRVTAAARREGEFPALLDRGRTIHHYRSWASLEAAYADARSYFRLDRTIGQRVSLYLGVEKAGMILQLQQWFGDLGVPIVALGGYSSQTYVDDVTRHAQHFTRNAVLLYAGDFDPSGEDIDRDFIARSDCWADVVRVALTHDQVVNYRLPINPGKAKDSRAAGFVERHGELMQVELDALDPDTLRQLFADALNPYWDTSAYEAVLEREREQLAS